MGERLECFGFGFDIDFRFFVPHSNFFPSFSAFFMARIFFEDHRHRFEIKFLRGLIDPASSKNMPLACAKSFSPFQTPKVTFWAESTLVATRPPERESRFSTGLGLRVAVEDELEGVDEPRPPPLRPWTSVTG